MIKLNPIPDDVCQRIPEAKKYLQSLQIVQFAYLFGSTATGRSNPLSDVDVAVYLNEYAVNPENKLEILGNLMAR